DVAALQSRHDAVGPERNGAHRGRVGDDGKDDLGCLRQRTWAVRPAHAGGDQLIRLVARAIPAGDAMAGVDEPPHDQLAHGAEADKPEVHAAISRPCTIPDGILVTPCAWDQRGEFTRWERVGCRYGSWS